MHGKYINPSGFLRDTRFNVGDETHEFSTHCRMTNREIKWGLANPSPHGTFLAGSSVGYDNYIIGI